MGKFRDRLRDQLKQEKDSLKEDMLSSMSDQRDSLRTSLSPGLDTSTRSPFAPAAGPGKSFDRMFTMNQVAYSEIKAAGDSVQLAAQSLPFFNYSMYRVGVPLMEGICIRNNSGNDLGELHLEARVRPLENYANATFPSLRAGKRHCIEELSVPIDRTALKNYTEPERGVLTLQVQEGGRTLHREERPLVIHPFTHCIINPDFPMPVATFVMPGCRAVETILDKVMEQQLNRFGEKSLADYQKGPEHVANICESVFYALRDDFDLGYISPPHKTGVEDGGQRVFTPDRILEHRRGTCFDLALLYCSILERCGLESIMCLGIGSRGGHAWIGCMLQPGVIGDMTIDKGILQQLLDRNLVLIMNSTDFTSNEAVFEDTCETGSNFIYGDVFDEMLWGIHIRNCRDAGALPLDID